MEFETALEKCISNLELPPLKPKQVGLVLVRYTISYCGVIGGGGEEFYFWQRHLCYIAHWLREV